MFTRISLFLTLCALALPAWAQQSLQTWIDLTPPGGVLRLPPGTYRGPALIEKPLTLEGNGKVVIDAVSQVSARRFELHLAPDARISVL